MLSLLSGKGVMSRISRLYLLILCLMLLVITGGFSFITRTISGIMTLWNWLRGAGAITYYCSSSKYSITSCKSLRYSDSSKDKINSTYFGMFYLVQRCATIEAIALKSGCCYHSTYLFNESFPIKINLIINYYNNS